MPFAVLCCDSHLRSLCCFANAQVRKNVLSLSVLTKVPGVRLGKETKRDVTPWVVWLTASRVLSDTHYHSMVINNHTPMSITSAKETSRWTPRLKARFDITI